MTWCEKEEIWPFVRRPLNEIDLRPRPDDDVRLFNVPPITLGERVRRRIVRKLPMWRPAPANPPTPSCDLNTHVGTSLERRAPRQRTLRVRSDRVISVSDPVWLSMESGRNDRWRFGSVVALPDDAMERGARGLMHLPGGGNVAMQRIPSSDLAMFGKRAADGMSTVAW